MNANKFIPFNQAKKEDPSAPDAELLNLTIAISLESSKLLECVYNKDTSTSRAFAIQLKQKLEQIISSLPNPQSSNTPFSNYVAITGTTQMVSTSTVNNEVGRALDNGGMAPPKEWKSITELNLKSSVKSSLVEEMRKLQEKGITISKSNFHHKTPLSINEFTEPFKYLENMHDYNGSLLITVLKSEIEINNQAETFQVDLKAEKEACLNGDKIIIYTYDIAGSAFSGEEKKFLIILNFDKLRGILKYDYAIFMNGKKSILSNRQLSEIDKFCKAKKINQ